MRVSLDIPDADVDAVSAQYQDRTPRFVAADGVPIESAAAHVARAISAWFAYEHLVARQRAADAVVAAASGDVALRDALLARSKIR